MLGSKRKELKLGSRVAEIAYGRKVGDMPKTKIEIMACIRRIMSGEDNNLPKISSAKLAVDIAHDNNVIDTNTAEDLYTKITSAIINIDSKPQQLTRNLENEILVAKKNGASKSDISEHIEIWKLEVTKLMEEKYLN